MLATPTLAALTEQAQQALLLAAAVSLPIMGVSAVVGLVMALVQSTTQIQDALVTHLPRLLLVGLALIWLGPWMGRNIAAFALRMFGG